MRERNAKRFIFFLIQQEHFQLGTLSKTKTRNMFLLAFNIFSVTSETSEQTSKPKFAFGLKSRLTFGEIENPFTVITSKLY